MSLQAVTMALLGLIFALDPPIGHGQSSAGATAPSAIDQKEEQQNRDDAAAVKALPVDYRECLLPILLDLMEPVATEPGTHLYVSVFGRDMDAQMGDLLARRGVMALPLSDLEINPPTPNPDDTPKHTSNWRFFAGNLLAEARGEYSLDAGYFCGGLCGGLSHYRFRIVGRTCSINSKELMRQF